MMDTNFRTLTAKEIECKAVVKDNMIEISLHTQAAVCTKMLNEAVGVMNWEKIYTNGNKNCVVRIWDEKKNMWVSKEDCGGPLTDVDGAKGQASNGFKRTCALGWGLGLELYSQPKILFPKTDDNVILDRNGEIVSEKYTVKEITYNDNREISRVVIINGAGEVVYDGPDENGESRVEYPVDTDEELVIPEDEEEVVAEEDDELPDNTDGFDDQDEIEEPAAKVAAAIVEMAEDGETQEPPYGNKDYRKEIESEIKRTHVSQVDVMKALGISSFNELDSVPEDVITGVLSRLNKMKTYKK